MDNVGEVAETGYRFVPTAEKLEELFRRYETARRLTGLSTTLERVSPRQRIDAIVIILGLNASKGWQRSGDESAEDLWLRYLTPVLAETRQSAAALKLAAQGGLPGTFCPEISATPGRTDDPPEDPPEELLEEVRSVWRRLPALWLEQLARRLADRRVVAILVLAVLAAFAALWLSGRSPVEVTVGEVAAPTLPLAATAPVAGSKLAAPNDPAARDYQMALEIALTAVDQAGGSLSPRTLAAFYAGESDRIGEPAVFLSAMMRRWPLPPDEPIPHSRAGANALDQYALAFVAAEGGEATNAAPMLRSHTSIGNEALQRRLTDFAAVEASSTDASANASVPARTEWPAWLPWLAFLPAFVALGWSVATFLPAVRAALTNPAARKFGSKVDLPVEALALTAPSAARKLARQISWREPGVARRIHAERSVSTTIRHGGFLTLVPRRRPRSAAYVFLVPRLRSDDHERDRISRFIEALARGGLALDVYDYDPDPRTLIPRTVGGDPRGDAVLDLRALRERHAQARLVLVTDGAELVEYFTQRPHDFVSAELALWPGRMMLTPRPIGEWGEREMFLSDALGAVIGRATSEGFRDLVATFGERPVTAPRPAPAPAGGREGTRSLVEQLAAWLDATERLLGLDDGGTRRPLVLHFEDAILTSDAEPPTAEQQALIGDLQVWLGPAGFHWLAATAAYPQLRFAITLYLGLKITVRYGPAMMPLYDEKRLAQLTLLPWFRTGRMPPWLRRALFASLPAPSRQRIRAAVDEMLNGAPLAKGPLPTGAHLPIWRPEPGGAEIPFDAVMADLWMPDRSEIVPILRGGAFSRIFRHHFMRVLGSRFRIVGATLAWCLGAWWLWPNSAAAPHPAGVWFPLIAFAGGTLFCAVGLLLIGAWGQRKAETSSPSSLPEANEPDYPKSPRGNEDASTANPNFAGSAGVWKVAESSEDAEAREAWSEDPDGSRASIGDGGRTTPPPA